MIYQVIVLKDDDITFLLFALMAASFPRNSIVIFIVIKTNNHDINIPHFKTFHYQVSRCFLHKAKHLLARLVYVYNYIGTNMYMCINIIVLLLQIYFRI